MVNGKSVGEYRLYQRVRLQFLCFDSRDRKTWPNTNVVRYLLGNLIVCRLQK